MILLSTTKPCCAAGKCSTYVSAERRGEQIIASAVAAACCKSNRYFCSLVVAAVAAAGVAIIRLLIHPSCFLFAVEVFFVLQGYRGGGGRARKGARGGSKMLGKPLFWGGSRSLLAVSYFFFQRGGRSGAVSYTAKPLSPART